MGAYSFIWDLDGTLLDSYGIILDGTSQALAEAGVETERHELHKRLIASSVRTVLLEIGRERGLDPDALWARVDELDKARSGEVRLMDGAAEALEGVRRLGGVSFVYTHNGPESLAVLERHGVIRYFSDFLTSMDGLPRKPAPDGIELLIARHGLDRSRVYYVGDRRIDVECAGNAGVGSILFLPPGGVGRACGGESFIVQDLRQVPEILRGLIEREKSEKI